MNFFQNKQIKNTTGDPFLDAVVELTSSDGNNYVSVTALRNSDIFTAIKILASDIASIPLQLFEGHLPKEDDKIIALFNDQPNKKMDGFHFKFCLAVNMLLNGNSFAVVQRDSKGTAIQLDVIANSEMNVSQLDDGTVRYTYGATNKPKRILKQSDVLHFKYFTQDGITGLSPLYALKDERAIQDAGNKTILNYFKRGVNSNGILKVKKSDLDKEAKENIRKKFEEANSSANGDNAIRTIILDDTMDYSKLEVDTSVLKLIHSNDWNTRQISKCFGIPDERLGVENAHSSAMQSNLIYLQNSLSHYFACFTSEINQKLYSKSDLSVRFNTERFTQTSPTDLVELTLKQVHGSLLTINEGRAKLGLAPQENGDHLLANLNYTYLDKLIDYQFLKKGNDEDESRKTTDGER